MTEQGKTLNHIEMTLTCDACEHNPEDCKAACLDGTCNLPQTLSTSKPDTKM